MRPSITVALMLGFGSLVFLGIAGVLVLGIWTAGENTRDLLADKAELASETLVGELERHLAVGGVNTPDVLMGRPLHGLAEHLPERPVRSTRRAARTHAADSRCLAS